MRVPIISVAEITNSFGTVLLGLDKTDDGLVAEAVSDKTAVVIKLSAADVDRISDAFVTNPPGPPLVNIRP